MTEGNVPKGIDKLLMESHENQNDVMATVKHVHGPIVHKAVQSYIEMFMTMTDYSVMTIPLGLPEAVSKLLFMRDKSVMAGYLASVLIVADTHSTCKESNTAMRNGLVNLINTLANQTIDTRSRLTDIVSKD